MDISHNLTSQALAALTKAGWSENRTVKVARWVDALTTEAYPVFSTAQLFMERFGGLRIPYVAAGFPDELVLDPLEGKTGVLRHCLQMHRDYLGFDLCVIGKYYAESMHVLVSEKSGFFAFGDDTLLALGQTDWQMLNIVLGPQPAQRLRD